MIDKQTIEAAAYKWAIDNKRKFPHLTVPEFVAGAMWAIERLQAANKDEESAIIKLAIADEPGFVEVPALYFFEVGGVRLVVHNEIDDNDPFSIDKNFFVISHLKSGRRISFASFPSLQEAIEAAKKNIDVVGVDRLQKADESCEILNEIEQ